MNHYSPKKYKLQNININTDRWCYTKLWFLLIKFLRKLIKKKNLQVKISELELAAFVAEPDLSFKVMEHLPHLIKSVCVDSDVAVGIKAGRKLTTKVINDKIGP